MKNFDKLVRASFAMVIAIAMLPSSLIAGNGGGTEPPKDESKSTFCTLLPSVCELIEESGNGGGDEPQE